MTFNLKEDLKTLTDQCYENAASVVDGETCASECDCFSCEMLNKIAKKIRSFKDDHPQ